MLVLREDTLKAFQDPLGELLNGFSVSRDFVLQQVFLTFFEFFWVAILDLCQGQAFPIAKIHLPQFREKMDRDVVRPGNQACPGCRSLEIACVNGIYFHQSKTLSYLLHLKYPCLGEAHIRVPNDWNIFISIYLAVPDKIDPA
jgi:hypothetical protein